MYHRRKNWWNFGFIAMYLSILFPQRKDELNLDEAAFEGMKGVLEWHRDGKNWLNFSEVAMYLSILASERAEILNGEIVITPKKPKLTREPKPLPQIPAF